MNITPITKKYTTPMSVGYNAFNAQQACTDTSAKVFLPQETIVNHTPKEFSNSRGNCLVDIDLSDCFIKNTVSQSPTKISFLADMELCDAFDDSGNKKRKVSDVSFTSKPDKYLYILGQSAINLYRNTKRNSISF